MAKFKFDAEETTVDLKPQQSGKRVRIVKLPSKNMNDVPERVDVFKPGRLVMNFAGEDEDNPGPFITHFDPPLELRVKFKKADQDGAADGKPKLAFWSEVENNWVLFTAEKHQFELQFNASGKGGTGVAFITHWGDPQIGWGT
jgi:hypothetical protein